MNDQNAAPEIREMWRDNPEVPRPEPDRPPEPSVLRRATTGISSVLDSFLNGMGKDGGGSKS